MVTVMGEITTSAYADIPRIVRGVVNEIGYTRSDYGFDGDTCAVITSIDEQSPDIAMGVDESYAYQHGSKEDIYEKTGAGDQGLMFGYACSETPEYMPLAITMAHKLCRRLSEVRKSGELDYLRPDGKSQVTVEYVDGKAKRIDTVVVSTQHDPEISQETLRRDILEKVIRYVIPAEYLDSDTKFFINPTGRFVIGGPQGDTGLTGRKIIVDTYGGAAPHGGGAFSGKDPTKVDRSACYAARYAAKNLVASGLCERCQIQLAYAIGVARPVSIMVDSFGTGKMSDEELVKIVERHFDFRPAAIIDKLDLRRPIYRQTAAYGHFGRTDLDLPWERLDKVTELQKEME